MLPRLSKVEYTILDLLRYGKEFYGLEMVHASEGKLKRGTIYVTLGRMEEKGIVISEAEKEPKHPGMPRRKYRINGEGQRLLNAVDAAQMAFVEGRV